jgi:hypothetical protein
LYESDSELPWLPCVREHVRLLSAIMTPGPPDAAVRLFALTLYSTT